VDFRAASRRARARHAPEAKGSDQRLATGPHLLDTTLFFSATSGGVRRYLLAKHDWLGRHGALTHTLVVPGATTGGTIGDIIEFASPRIPFGAGYRCPWRLRRLRALLERLEPDLVEAGDPYQIGWQAAQVAEHLGIPAVAFCHSDFVGLLANRVGRVTGTAAARYLRSLYARFDLVLAPSRIIAERLDTIGIGRVAVQPLGVDAETFHPERADSALRASLQLPPGTRLLTFAGRLAREKNVGDLKAMVEYLGHPYHLLIIGGARAERPSPRVTVLPYQREPSRLAAWLASSDAIVHAGQRETFGLVALEAMACARPVVVYNAGALPEIVDARVGQVAPNRGPRALAAAVSALFAREPLALGLAGRKRVLEHFTWDRVFHHELGRYAALINRPTLLRGDGELQTA
jgi:alpha-1,6-mannosyltransferase